jgi:hypothetical protein
MRLTELLLRLSLLAIRTRWMKLYCWLVVETVVHDDLPTTLILHMSPAGRPYTFLRRQDLQSLFRFAHPYSCISSDLSQAITPVDALHLTQFALYDDSL